jgi:hypothetical protein
MRERFRRRPEIDSAPLERECILYSPGLNKFLHLNSTASFIWSRLEGPVTAESVADALARSFEGVRSADALRDVESLLKEMVDLSVVEVLPAAVEDVPLERENP